MTAPPPRTPMARTHEEMISRALEMHPDLLPVAAELLADFDALGSEPEVIVEVLREIGVGAGDHVVDLGCGKGAACRAVARGLGCRVVGVELFPPFVTEARSLTAEAGLGDRVTFALGNATEPPSPDLVGDVVIFAAMGDLLGPLDEALASLRRWVRPGGFVVIDDSVLLDDAGTRAGGYETYTDRDRSRQRLESRGDRVVIERVVDGDRAEEHRNGSEDGKKAGKEDDNENGELAALRRRAAALAAHRPELAEALADFIEEQARQYAFLDEDTVGMVWVVQLAG